MTLVDEASGGLVDFGYFSAMAGGRPEKRFIRMARDGRFPSYVRIGHSPPRWRKDQVEAWFAALLAPIQASTGDNDEP